MLTKNTNLHRAVIGLPAAFTTALLAVGLNAQASTDYGPAIWKPTCNANYYTTGYGHKFHVVHDMEGYYAAVVSLFTSCNYTAASVHYAINGKQDAGSDAAPGEVTQMIRDANYAWHALCWNSHCTGTEHEGFASNPAWYTEAQYQASAGVTRNMANKNGYAKDRNHIVGHGEKSNSAWVAWANANLGINATCNTHTDPGPYWDWSHYIALVNGGGARNAVCDFDGDGKTDITIYDTSNFHWKARGLFEVVWGLPGEIPVPGDYNGDGKTDVCIYRPSTGEWVNRDTGTTIQWGLADEIPVPGDYNGDGITDICVYNTTTFHWKARGLFDVVWGATGEVPVPGDYNGDKKTEVCVYRPGAGQWVNRDLGWTIGWGLSGEVPVPGDYNGDGKTDICMYRPSNGQWVNRDTGTTIAWGLPGEIPQPADYNGDGKTDICVYRPNTGEWVNRDTGTTIQWGLQTEFPVVLPYAIRRVYYP
jgi:hypothetical protein